MLTRTACPTRDVRPDTVLPEVPTRELKRNHYIAPSTVCRRDGVVAYSLLEAGGCSGTQIVESAGLGEGRLELGISKTLLKRWIASLSELSHRRSSRSPRILSLRHPDDVHDHRAPTVPGREFAR